MAQGAKGTKKVYSDKRRSTVPQLFPSSEAIVTYPVYPSRNTVFVSSSYSSFILSFTQWYHTLYAIPGQCHCHCHPSRRHVPRRATYSMGEEKGTLVKGPFQMAGTNPVDFYILTTL